MTAEVSDWLSRNFPELSGALLGLVYIVLSVRQKILTWPFGIATSVIYAFVFYSSRFYAGMGLQVYYVAISLYGWYYWIKGKRPRESQELPVTQITRSILLWGTVLTGFSFTIIFLFLSLKTDSPVPFMDALTTSLSITATWMLARKVLENWLVWIFADLLYIGLYAFQNLWPTVLLFSVYEALAIYGYFRWKQSMTKQG